MAASDCGLETRRRNSNIATIAAEIGYESEAAFSRAFKRSVGTPPAEWRSKRLSSSAIARS
jgi:AraC-like DNA-binding protein